MELRRDELQQAIVFYETQLGRQRQRKVCFEKQLSPLQKAIPQVLKSYLVNNAHKIDFGSLTPLSRLTIQKYLFYNKAISSISLLIDKIIEKLDQMKKQAEELHVYIPAEDEEENFKKPQKICKRKRMSHVTNCFERIPTEIFQKIIGFLDFSSLLNASMVNKFFYRAAGNDISWFHLCENYKISDPKPCFQTWKNVFALYQLGKKK